MNMDDLRDYLDTLSDEDQEAFLAALRRDYEGEGARSDRDYVQADQYATTPWPKMRRTGRFATAASPLEFAGSLAQRGVGEYLRRGARQRSTESSAAKQSALGHIQQLMMARQSPGPVPASQPSMVDLLRGGKPF